MRPVVWSRTQDQRLTELVGRVPAAKIAEVLGRTTGQVHRRVKTLGLKGHIRGEDHWAAVLSDPQAKAVGILFDAGVSIKDIHTLLNDRVAVSYGNVLEVCHCLTRTGV